MQPVLKRLESSTEFIILQRMNINTLRRISLTAHDGFLFFVTLFMLLMSLHVVKNKVKIKD